MLVGKTRLHFHQLNSLGHVVENYFTQCKIISKSKLGRREKVGLHIGLNLVIRKRVGSLRIILKKFR